MTHPSRFAALGLLALFCATAALASDHYVVAGKGALNALLQSGDLQSGDRVMLGNGRHGVLKIDNATFTSPVVFTPASGAKPVIDRVIISNSQNITLERLTVRPSPNLAGQASLVHIKNGHSMLLDRLDISTSGDSASWTAPTWRQLIRNGVVLSGRDITLRNSRIHTVRHGITNTATNALIQNNTIENFAADGIRGLADGSKYISNDINTCVKIDDNHDDGFQSWSVGEDGKPGTGVVRDVLVENNLIRNGSHRLTCTLQGIGMFDGMYENWTIRGNTIITNHWHGITVMGAKNVKIERNIVVQQDAKKIGPPWISITAHRDGRIAVDSLVAHNITQPNNPNAQFSLPQPGVNTFANRTARTAKAALKLGRK